MTTRRSLALAIAVTSSGQALAADWSGPFAGITGGGAGGFQSQHDGLLALPSGGGISSSGTIVSMSTSSSTFSSGFSNGPEDGHYRTSGGLVGGAVGYNWQSDHLVYGIEGDASWARITGSGTCGVATPHACGGGIDALGTVRGKIGYDLGTTSSFPGGVLVFATGGLAVADVKAWDALFGTSGSKAEAGWTVGGGVEVRVAQGWSVKLEYLHVDLGDPALFHAIPAVPEHVRTTDELVRVGLTYHFDFQQPQAPLVARY